MNRNRPAFEFIKLYGPEVDPYRAALGALRISVFREYPYLYDGDAAYEEQYLSIYSRSPNSLVVLVYHEGQLIGATTCIPMNDESEEFQQPFLKAGFALHSILYLGESILLPEFRGHGVGHQFFDFREHHAAALKGTNMLAFCAIDRPDNHPRRPPEYRSLQAFWQRMGFQRQSQLNCELRWREIDESRETPKKLTFWTKVLGSA